MRRNYFYSIIAATQVACSPCRATGDDFGIVCPEDTLTSTDVLTDTTSNDATDGDMCGLSAGQAFGPCLGGACVGPALTCVTEKTGDVCLPPCGQCEDGAWDSCLDEISDLGHAFRCDAEPGSPCRPECVEVAPGVSNCNDGMVCDVVSGTCVWPTPSAKCSIVQGKPWGPCHADQTCDDDVQCATSASGNICAPPYSDCSECTGTCVELLGDGTPGCKYGAVNVCVAACVADSGCHGGTVCDEVLGLCVWPT